MVSPQLGLRQTLSNRGSFLDRFVIEYLPPGYQNAYGLRSLARGPCLIREITLHVDPECAPEFPVE